MNREQEIEWFKENGRCPYLGECEDSNGCNGKVDIFCVCRAPHINPEYLLSEKSKEIVMFT